MSPTGLPWIKRGRRIAVLAFGTLAVLANSTVAGAAPSHGPGYPAYPYEGSYPDSTPCSGSFAPRATTTGTYGGRTMTLKYFYNDRCGSFARIENAPGNCTVILDRSTDGGNSWAWVQESVDPGIDFAFTQMGNNLEGRVSRGALACDRNVVVRTDWY